MLKVAHRKVAKRAKAAKKPQKKAAKKSAYAPKKRTYTAVRQSVAAEVLTKLRDSRHEADPNEAFWVNNGPICRNVPELKLAIADMTDDQFEYHTKRNGNDFAAWLEQAMCHDECARKIRKAHTRAAAIRALAVCDDH